MKNISFYGKYLLPIPVYCLAYLSFSSTGLACYLVTIYAFGLLPFLELFLKPDLANLTDAEQTIAAKDKVFDFLLYAIVPLQYAALFYFLYSLKVDYAILSTADVVGRVSAMGILCGVFGINVGHELGHRNTLYEQWMAKLLLLTSMYTHFFIEHNKGHHKNVATPNDPSSARLNEPIYLFYFRTIYGTYKGAWHISLTEDKKRGSALWKNEMLGLQLLQVLLLLVIFIAFGFQILLCFVGAAFIGLLLLETVNYIEHYGLSRNEIANGKYERALPIHSWNSNHVLGRITLFELSRHSDHHYLASRKYQVLRHFEESPQLPTGYPGSMILALVPPLWFAIMNKKIAAIATK
jgi:alkane 1-monooxygenase